MNIPFVHQKLANGLDVIVHEDHDCPIVAVNVWYHVGSKNEQPGHTGFAHLFEHLMFEGSQHHDSGYFRPLQEIGGVLNGSTNADRTNYWEVVPSNALDLALWMESDRMGYLLPALTDAKFENQRNVVLNERRQNYENRPYGFAGMSLVAALYPPEHPYHWMTIGAAEDLKAARLDDVRAFFQTYYRPRNASLALAGDIDAERAIALATEYFGGLDAGPEPPPVEARYLPLAGETRLVLEDRIELPRLYLAWHSPALFAEDDAELDLVSEVLAGGKTSTVVPESGLRTAHCDRGGRVAGLARAWQFLSDRRDRRAGPDARGARGGRGARAGAAPQQRGRPRPSSNAAWPRRKRTSCTGCKPSAVLAGSRIS